MPRFMPKAATITAGESLSAAIDCSTGAPVFLHMPAEWTPAKMTFQVSPDGTNYTDLFTGQAFEIAVNVVAGTSIRLDPLWSPITCLKVRSGGRETPVPQEADRTLTITVDTQAAAV